MPLIDRPPEGGFPDDWSRELPGRRAARPSLLVSTVCVGILAVCPQSLPPHGAVSIQRRVQRATQHLGYCLGARQLVKCYSSARNCSPAGEKLQHWRDRSPLVCDSALRFPRGFAHVKGAPKLHERVGRWHPNYGGFAGNCRDLRACSTISCPTW